MPPVIIAQTKSKILGLLLEESKVDSWRRSFAGPQIQPAHILRITSSSSPRAQLAFPSRKRPDLMRAVARQDTPCVRRILHRLRERWRDKVLGRSAAHAAPGVVAAETALALGRIAA